MCCGAGTLKANQSWPSLAFQELACEEFLPPFPQGSLRTIIKANTRDTVLIWESAWGEDRLPSFYQLSPSSATCECNKAFLQGVGPVLHVANGNLETCQESSPRSLLGKVRPFSSITTMAVACKKLPSTPACQFGPFSPVLQCKGGLWPPKSVSHVWVR